MNDKKLAKNGRGLPLVVIVGPTASGKTSLSVSLAKKLNGEIISADSRAVYKNLDIGTAKPSLSERQGVLHWGIDLVGPSQKFSVVDFQNYAQTKIGQIRQRGRVPFLVGGTGLYVDSIIFDYEFAKDADYDLEREKYSVMSLAQLWSYCLQNNIPLPENSKNRRYVINQILRVGRTASRRFDIIDNCLVFGIKTDKNELKNRIGKRVDKMFESGVIEEARLQAKLYGWENESMTGNVYPIVRRYIEGLITQEQAVEESKQSDWHLVKRQLTWFKRNQAINWLNLKEAETKIIQKVSGVLI